MKKIGREHGSFSHPLRILDLFCGLGGVARGFQTFLIENGIDFEYYAIDIDDRILKAHKVLNPRSIVIKRDAYSFSDEELRNYDFIWASPPCETHSIMGVWKRKVDTKPDMRLYELIDKLYDLGKPFVVENIKPYYRPPIRPTSRANRHILWSNLEIPPIKVNLPTFTNIKNKIDTLARYHEIQDKIDKIRRILGNRTRDALRDMVYWKISYQIAKRVIPQIINDKILLQLRLFA